jgi:antitoxin HicB
MTEHFDPDRLGSSLDDALAADGLLAEVRAVAIKRVITWELEQEMKRQHVSKSALARQMRTSRAAVDRLLDPLSPSVTLLTLERAARVLGRKLLVQLG